MLLTHKDKDDKVIAYLEYEIVDKWGHPCEGGQYCYVRDIFVHKSIKNKFNFKTWVELEHPKYPQVKFLYWQRQKYQNRMSIYDITRFYKGE